MKVTLNRIDSGENEVIINYTEMNGEVEDVIRAAGGANEKLLCTDGDTKFMLPVRDVLYAESVDRTTFIYTSEGVYRTVATLQALEPLYADRGFFRCSKSMIINILRISELRSESGGRIDVKMENGEHVIISRSYAKAFRRELKGEE